MTPAPRLSGEASELFTATTAIKKELRRRRYPSEHDPSSRTCPQPPSSGIATTLARTPSSWYFSRLIVGCSAPENETFMKLAIPTVYNAYNVSYTSLILWRREDDRRRFRRWWIVFKFLAREPAPHSKRRRHDYCQLHPPSPPPVFTEFSIHPTRRVVEVVVEGLTRTHAYTTRILHRPDDLWFSGNFCVRNVYAAAEYVCGCVCVCVCRGVIHI